LSTLDDLVHAGKIRRGHSLPASSRLQTQWVADIGPQIPDEYLFQVVDALDSIAAETEKTIPQIAFNWLMQRPSVSKIIFGARIEA
jgi:aryl-alcohol dehydrogenase-like predicted oxidoreductase